MATVSYDENRQDRYRETKVQTGMAVDYGGVIYPAQGQPQGGGGGGIMTRIEEHPVVALMIGLIFAIAAGYLISKLRGTASSTSTSTTNQPGTSQGLPTTDAQGNKVYYVPTSNTFLDYNNIQSSYNPNNSVATTTTSSTTTNSSDVDNGQDQAPAPAPHYGTKPLIPYGQYKGPTYKPGVNTAADLGTYTWYGVKYKISAGGPLGQDIWGTTPQGQKLMLYNTANQYYGVGYDTPTMPVGST